jgi:hypothetical protein
MNTIWDYTPEELTGLVRDHVDAVLAADAEANEYRSFIRKGIFEKLIGEQGKYGFSRGGAFYLQHRYDRAENGGYTEVGI